MQDKFNSNKIIPKDSGLIRLEFNKDQAKN